MQNFFCNSSNHGKNRYIILTPELIDFTGDVISGLVLSYLLFWSFYTKKPEKWIWKSYPDWFMETRLTEYQVRPAARRLKAKGIIEIKIMKACGAPTLHYRVISSEDCLAVCFPNWIVSRGGVVRRKKSENVCMSAQLSGQGMSLEVDFIDRLMDLIPSGNLTNNIMELVEKYASRGEAYIKSQIEYVNKRCLKKGGYAGYLARALEKNFAAHNASSHADYSSPIKFPKDGEVVLYQGAKTEVQNGMIFDQAGRAINPARLLSLIGIGEVKLLNGVIEN